MSEKYFIEMNIAIIGTRGIPNCYGGFEQFAEYLSLGLVKQGHEVTVYNSHTHPYQEKKWKEVNIVHCFDPENKTGTVGQFIYDLNCILDTRRKQFDIILQLGYTSSSVWGWLLPRKKSVITTNMDGLEWKRTKYAPKVRRFLQYAEKLGVQYSDYLISDSLGIQKYLKEKYGKDSLYIPYGARLFTDPDPACLKTYSLTAYGYNMLIARLEPENSIETILDGVVNARDKKPFLIIGNHHTKFGEYLKEKFKSHSHIRFLGGLYDIDVLNNLRHYSNLYFHGHMVGGTNPSLLEAMASQSLICAHSNIFNRSILNEDAFYFETIEEVTRTLDTVNKQDYSDQTVANEDKIKRLYDWDIIIEQYIRHFKEIVR